jgi:hypothetical protein
MSPLFFADVARLPFLQFLIVNYRHVYRVFGSGSMHGPYAIFQKQAITFNGGQRLGLIRAADNRMAGYFTAFHRMLRLKPALEATIASAEFIGLKLTKPVVVNVVAFLKDPGMWNAMHVLTRCLFPALRVLRLADKSQPGFDCLYHYICKTDKAMEWSTRSFNSVCYFTSAVRDPLVLEDILRNGGVNANAMEEDEFMSMITEGYDDSDGEGDSDDDSHTLPYAGTGRDLGRNILALWERRKVNMVSDFCIAGLLLAPLQDVMEDVRANRTGVHNEAMDRIIKKLYYNRTKDELGTILDMFWTEWDEFNQRNGRFGDVRKYIWNSELLRKQRSAKWHGQYTVPNTEVSFGGGSFVLLLFFVVCLTIDPSLSYLSEQVLGKVACRILSALLGIGIAERSWGAVKQLKQGQRAHLGGESVRMQATIYGAACIEKARTLKAEKEQSMELWNDNDVDFQLGLENFNADEANQVVRVASPKCLFRAWLEEWEEESVLTNDIVHETRLLHKYGGLKWVDPDTDIMFVVDTTNMDWHGKRSGGWHAIALREDGQMDPWPIHMLPALMKRTSQDPSLNIEFVHLTRDERAKRSAARAEKWKGKNKRKRPKNDYTDSDTD